LPIGLGGVWNWRGTVGKATGPNGEPRDVKGVITDFDLISWEKRTALVAYDSDLRENESVRAARTGLMRELRNRGARVVCLEWDPATGKGIDDHLAAVGPHKVLEEIAPTTVQLPPDDASSAAAPESVQQLLARCGFDTLNSNSSVESIETTLRILGSNVSRVDKLRLTAVREAAIKRLEGAGVGSPARFVDAALDTCSIDQTAAELQGRAVVLRDPEPWIEEVDGAALLDEIAAIFRRYLVLPRDAVLMPWACGRFTRLHSRLPIPRHMRRSHLPSTGAEKPEASRS
jgi:hypothetical protein